MNWDYALIIIENTSLMVLNLLKVTNNPKIWIFRAKK